MQVRVCHSIVELDGFDAAEVVVVASVLGVRGGRGECRFGDEFVGLVVEVGERVGAEEAVD